MAKGFRIGFKYQYHTCESDHKNMVSARQNAQVVKEYLVKEQEAGRVVGPIYLAVLPNV